jgi:hypothetical protein
MRSSLFKGITPTIESQISLRLPAAAVDNGIRWDDRHVATESRRVRAYAAAQSRHFQA